MQTRVFVLVGTAFRRLNVETLRPGQTVETMEARNVQHSPRYQRIDGHFAQLTGQNVRKVRNLTIAVKQEAMYIGEW